MSRFLGVERDQQFLLPPDMREWLSPDHFAFFLADTVDQLDLAAFESAYSSDGRGRKAFHPSVLIGVVLYGSATGVTSSRALQRACWTDVAFRVVSANSQPDHTTISKFLTRHGAAIEGLFVQVLALAVDAGVVRASTIAVDGTKMKAAASASANTPAEALREEFAAWEAQVRANDAADDEADSDSDDDGPIDEAKDPARRRAWIRERLRERADAGGDSKQRVNRTDPDSGLMPMRGGGFIQGYNTQAVADETGIIVAVGVADGPNDHQCLEAMATKACRNLADVGIDTPTTILGDAGYWSSTVADIAANNALPDPLITPDRKLPKTAPEPLPDLPDHDTLEHDLTATRAAVFERYRHGDIDQAQGAAELGIRQARFSELWIAYRDGGPDAIRRRRRANGQGNRPKPPTTDKIARDAMRTRLTEPDTRARYKRRSPMIEPVFAQIKHNRHIRAFQRVTRAKITVDWTIHAMTSNLIRTHNTRPT